MLREQTIERGASDAPTWAPGQCAIAADAREALIRLGWKPAIARAAVEAALADLDEDAPLPAVIREALRRCR